MDKELRQSPVDLSTNNGHTGMNGTNGQTKEASKEEKHEASLLDAAKAAAVEVTNGLKGLAISS